MLPATSGKMKRVLARRSGHANSVKRPSLRRQPATDACQPVARGYELAAVSLAPLRGSYDPPPLYSVKNHKKALHSEGFPVAGGTLRYRTPQLAPGYVGAAVGLLSQYIRVVKSSGP